MYPRIQLEADDTRSVGYLRQFPADEMEAFAVSKDVGNV